MWKYKKLVFGLITFLIFGSSCLKDIQTEIISTTSILPYRTLVPTATIPMVTESPMVSLNTNTSNPSPTSSSTSTPTPSPLPPSPTPTPTPVQFIEAPFYNVNCLDILSELPETRLATGNIMFESMMETDQVMIMNMETRNQQILEGYYFVSGEQSPNHQWIAINEYGKGKLMLMDANGELYEVSEWDEKWQWISGWLNEEQLIIGLVDEGDYSRLPPLGLLNIQTKEYREIIRNYPRHTIIDEFEPFLSWYTTTFFDPSLSFVAYPAYPEDDWGESFILYDLRSHRIITELMDYRTRTLAPPQWTPDGTHLLIPKEDYQGEPLPEENHEEFFLVSSKGDVNQLTHFNDYHEFSRIGSFAFSFDGRYVAFWFQDRSISNDEYLYMLDLNTQEVMNTCLSSQRTPSAAPVWSPENYSFIAARDIYKDESDPNSVFSSMVYIDVNNGFAAEVAEHMWTLGWLINTPGE